MEKTCFSFNTCGTKRFSELSCEEFTSVNRAFDSRVLKVQNMLDFQQFAFFFFFGGFERLLF